MVKKEQNLNTEKAELNSVAFSDKKIKESENTELVQAPVNLDEDVKLENTSKLDATADAETNVDSNLSVDNGESISQENIDETKENDSETNEELSISVSKEIVDEKIKEVLETQTPKKKRKSTIINLCLLLVNIIFMIFIVKNFMGDVDKLDFGLLVKEQGNKLWWLAGGVLVYVVYMFSQTVMYKVLIKNLTGKRRWGLSYDVAVLGKYYDNVTPFAVGGQPMQIVRLVSNKISPGVSTSIPIIKMIVNSTVNMFIALGFFIFAIPRIPISSALNNILLLLFEILGVIGLIITVIVVVFMYLISSGSLFTRSFISGLLRIGYKLKIVKNYRAAYKKFINQVAEYRSSMSYLWRHRKLLLKMILLSIVECLTYASLPYFVVMGLMPESVVVELSPFLFFVICIARYYICFMASSFIPLPGGTGLIEISFIFLFWSSVSTNIVWTFLFWRFLSYYLIIIHGFIHELSRIFINIAKNNKNKQIKA